jgi:hypothetical protein
VRARVNHDFGSRAAVEMSPAVRGGIESTPMRDVKAFPRESVVNRASRRPVNIREIADERVGEKQARARASRRSE